VLLHLSIRDFIIVEELDLDFGPGFTALTGETGAGKSILIDALSLALGDRAESEQVRAGAQRADISAEFAARPGGELAAWLSEQALEGDGDQVLLRRVIDRGGRSRAFVNGHPATVAQLREAGEQLLDIHGQHAHQSLLKPAVQRAILDAYGGHDALSAEVADRHRQWTALVRLRRQSDTDAAARDAEMQQLGWQLDELGRLEPVPGEWERIEAEQSRLAHAAALIEGAQAGVQTLGEADSATLSTLGAVLGRLSDLAAIDARLREPVAMLEGARANLQEALTALRRYSDRVELDPKRLLEADERLAALHGASRRFKVPPDGLPALREQLQRRADELRVQSDTEELARREASARDAYDIVAARLSKAREKSAPRLSRAITDAMKDLAMPGGRFEAFLVQVEGGSAHGNEAVEFLVSANPGTEARPLAKVASGGELSRISLAIQVITSSAQTVPTLIFDEVDAGIGGGVAEVVGRRLSALAATRQVLCVTHLAQVAAQADQQWSVSKRGDGGKAGSRVRVLDGKARVEELARMLGGLEITATTRKHAQEMLGGRGR
jgi:DNA repair protein RecN (Recombination protein N)